MFVLWHALGSVSQNTVSSSPSAAPTHMPSMAAHSSVAHTSGLERIDSGDSEKLGGYPFEVLSKVRSKWYPQIPALKNTNKLKAGNTVIEFSIKNDGSLRSVRTSESSGSSVLDDAAYGSVLSSAPFAVFPAASVDKQLTFRMHFGYSQAADAGTAACDGPDLGAHPGEGVVLHKVGNGVEPPHATFSPDPEFSEEARKTAYQSEVVVGGTVDVGGTFSDLCIVQAAGLGLDAIAMQTVGKWKFQPATLRGEAVPVRVSIEVTYRLY